MLLLNRHHPSSVLRWGTCKLALVTTLSLLLIALIGSLTLYVTQYRPVLMKMPTPSKLEAFLDEFAQSLPDGRVVVHPNASVSINRPVPIVLSAGAQGVVTRVAFEPPAASIDQITRKYLVGNANAHSDAIISGSRLLLLDTSGFSQEMNATFYTPNGLVPLRYQVYNLSNEPGLEAPLSVVCEAVQPEELEGMLAREEATRVKYGQKALAAAGTNAVFSGTGLARSLVLTPAQIAQFKDLLSQSFRYYNSSLLISSAHGEGLDVITYRLVHWWYRVQASLQARGLAAAFGGGSGAGPLIDVNGLGAGGMRRYFGGAAAGGNNNDARIVAASARRRQQAVAGQEMDRALEHFVDGEGGGPLVQALHALTESIAGDDGRFGADGSTFTSAYVCTRETFQAAVSDLRHNALFSKLASGYFLPLMLAGVSFVVLFISAASYFLLNLWTTTLAVYLLLLLIWKVKHLHARFRPQSTEILRVVVFSSLPLVFWFQVVSPLWLPDMPQRPPIYGGTEVPSSIPLSPLSSPRAFLASLRITSPWVQWLIHYGVALVVATIAYEPLDGAQQAEAAVGAAAAAAVPIAGPQAPATVTAAPSSATGTISLTPSQLELLAMLAGARGGVERLLAEQLHSEASKHGSGRSISRRKRHRHKRRGRSRGSDSDSSSSSSSFSDSDYEDSESTSAASSSAAGTGLRRRRRDGTSSAPLNTSPLASSGGGGSGGAVAAGANNNAELMVALQRQIASQQAAIQQQLASLTALQQHHALAYQQAMAALRQQPMFAAPSVPQPQHAQAFGGQQQIYVSPATPSQPSTAGASQSSAAASE